MADKSTRTGRSYDATDESADDPRVVNAVKEYLTLLEAGGTSRDAFLGQHADIAEILAEYLDGLELVHDAAAEVRGAVNSLAMSAGQPPALGDYRILRELGRGGMGIVYEAIHVPLARRVALKVLPLVSSFDAMRLKRFKSEAQAVARLQHPNIVQVYAVGCENDVHFYAMQLIDGYPLSAAVAICRREHGKAAQDERQESRAAPRPITTHNQAGQSIDRTAPVDETARHSSSHSAAEWLDADSLSRQYADRNAYFRSAVRLVRQAALALEHAHTSGVIHRDVKPANLLIDRTGHPWVADFGLARIATDSDLTRTGVPLGTIRFMSPEQATGDRGLIDHRTDIYSLGVTLYELLTLEPAIPGEESHSLLRRVIDDEPRPPSAIDNNIPVDLETIIRKAAAKTPAERYESAQALADDLERWLEDKPILAKPPTVLERTAKWRRRHRVLVQTASIFGGIAACALVFATLLIGRAYQREAQQRRAAETSFARARQAVDAFSELGETELAAKPELRDVRRRMLDLSLGYYRQFVAEHSDDPAAVAELAATSERVERIVNELKVLEGSAPLLLMSDRRVQDDLRLTEAQRERIDAQLARFTRERAEGESGSGQSTQDAQKRLADLLRTHEAALTASLRPEQSERLQQIARQQRAPFVFRSPEIIEALALSPQQRQQVNTIIEEERIDGGGRQTLASGGPPPRSRRQDGFRPDGPPPDGPPPYGDRPPSPPPNGFDPGGPPLGPPPNMRDGNRRGERPPPPDEFGAGPGGGPGGMADSKKRTTQRILAILTPEQRTKWDELTGRPFAYDLNWGPDDLLPH